MMPINPVPLPTREALPEDSGPTRWSRGGRWRMASFVLDVVVLVLAVVVYTSDRENFTTVILPAGIAALLLALAALVRSPGSRGQALALALLAALPSAWALLARG